MGQPWADKNLELMINPDDPMYIIYTSGSTGTPKGVICRHRSVNNRFDWFKANYPLMATDIYAQKAPFTFVDSIWEIFYPLANGITTCITPDSILLNMHKLARFISDKKITRLDLVPSLLNILLSTLKKNDSLVSSINLWTISGEMVQSSTVDKFFAILPDHRLLNRYGSTESTSILWYDTKNWCKTQSHFMPIGQPISNTEIYILDENLVSVGNNQIGELFVTGDSLALGYINNTPLTQQKFITLYNSERAYKTGDMVRMLPDGNIEFHGRKDQLVKMYGNLVELSEIETAIQSSKLVNSCAVLCWEIDGENELCAYIVATNINGSHIITQIKELLKSKLPVYMQPQHFILLTHMPLNANGKVDRTQLTKPITYQSYTQNQPNTNDIEQMKQIWQTVFKFQKIESDSEFFKLGGNSFLAAKLISYIQKSFNIEMEITTIFEFPILNNLYHYIKNNLNSIARNTTHHTTRQLASMAAWQQQSLWFINQYPGNPEHLYNLDYSYLISGNLQIEYLQQALIYLIHTHENLRTVFKLDQVTCQQIILEEYKISLPITVIAEKELYPVIKSNREIKFNLSRFPPWTVKIYQIKPDKFLLQFIFHHIIIDDIAYQIFLGQLSQIYNQLCTNPDMPKIQTLQYKDYSGYQNLLLNTEKYKQQLKFWINYLDEAKPSQIEYSYQKPINLQQYGKHLVTESDTSIQQQITQLTTHLKITRFMLFLGVFNIVLNRYTRQADLLIGSPISNRKTDFLEVIGFFLHTLPIRTKISQDMTIADFLIEQKNNCINIFSNQDIPLSHITEHFRDKSGTNNLFNHIFVYQQQASTPDFKDCYIENIKSENNTSKFDLSLFVLENPQNIKIYIEYNQQLYDKQVVQSISDLYLETLTFICSNTDKLIADCPLLTETETTLLMDRCHGQSLSFTQKNLFELFTQQVDLTPENIALDDGYCQLTYRELYGQVNVLAAFIHKHITHTDNPIIGVCYERSIDMVTALLAILKAGAAYVPVAPDFPEQRNQHIITECALNLILCNDETFAQSTSLSQNNNTMSLLNTSVYLKQTTDKNQINDIPDANLACVLFTSGSTGKPKGIKLNHDGLINRILWMIQAYKLSADDIVLFKTPYTFDVSIGEIFAALAVGAKLFIATGKTHRDTRYLTKLIADKHITWINFVPAQLEQLIEEHVQQKTIWNNLRLIISSGEALSYTLAKKILNALPTITLLNVYGPTETGEVTSYACNLKDYPDKLYAPIGSPMFNCKCYVLDKDLLPVPIGVSGELYISGKCLADGYINNPQLNKQAFLDDIHNIHQDGKLYKTGDIVRWLASGELEYINRQDFQVKINGLRIELGEIEKCLVEIPAIKHAVVLNKSINNNQALIAYYIIRENYTLKKTQIINHLQQYLPAYMLPQIWVELTTFAININGKIDRQYLLNLPLEDEVLITNDATPQNLIEEQLLAIWQQLFTNNNIRTTNNFFSIGGNSLNSVKLLHQINTQFNLNLNLEFIFQYPTINGMAQIISDYLHNNSAIAIQNEFLIKLNNGITRGVVCYLFPPAISGAETYTIFAGLFPDNIPLYAFNSYNKYNHKDTKSNIEELARIYADEIIKHTPEIHEYILGGWSLGGLIAYATADILHKLIPAAVIKIFMIDSRLKIPGTYDYNARNSANLDKFINQIRPYVTADFNDKQLLDDIKLELLIQEEFIPVQTRLSTYLFVATDYVSNSSAPELWQGYAQDIKINYLPTNHHTIMQKKSLAKIVKYLCNEMNLNAKKP